MHVFLVSLSYTNVDVVQYRQNKAYPGMNRLI